MIREKFTDEEIEAMGLQWIVTMHEPIYIGGSSSSLLGADRRGDGSWLETYGCDPDYEWPHDCGFAFVVSQIQQDNNNAD